MSIFGPIIHAVQVDDAVTAHLRKWLPTHLSQVERDTGRSVGFLARPVLWTSVYDEGQFADKRLPALLVITGGTDAVERHGDGSYSALWDVLISSVVRGRNDADVRLVASLYGAAVVRCMLQHASLGGFAGGVAWRGHMPLVPLSDTVDRGRHLLVAQSRWFVQTDDVVSDRDGPVDPEPQPDPQTPYPDGPTVEEVDVQVDGLPIT
jgi:hypothetical protein